MGTQLEIGCRCTVHVDYGNQKLLRGKTARIVKFQRHGTQQFARVIWNGLKSIELEDEFGTLFELRDLKPI